MKPTEKEIQEASSRAYNTYKRTRSFGVGFKLAIEWLLNWQKTQPLTVYYVIDSRIGIVGVNRTEESAKANIEDFKKSLPLGEFYIKAIILK